MKLSDFDVNQRFDILLAKDPGAERFPSRVEAIDEDRMEFAMPISKGVPILLSPGDAFCGRVVLDGTVWMFTSTFIDKRFLPVAVWIVTMPADFERIQLRSFVRLDTALVADLEVVGSSRPPIQAITRNIGGGGAKLVVKQPLDRGARVQFAVELPDNGILRTLGEVIRVEHDEKRNFYAVAVKFVEIPERERDKIIKYIFRRQLARRQSGLENQ